MAGGFNETDVVVHVQSVEAVVHHVVLVEVERLAVRGLDEAIAFFEE